MPITIAINIECTIIMPIGRTRLYKKILSFEIFIIFYYALRFRYNTIKYYKLSVYKAIFYLIRVNDKSGYRPGG
jgi:hypothetical protein